jgi:glycosyltransferase involved in cell wall biosynthesis
LTCELVRRGHSVTLFASGDSTTAGDLTAIVPRSLRANANGLTDHAAWQLYAIGRMVERLREFDVVHSHLDYLCFPSLRGAGAPLLTTLHGRLDLDGLREIYGHYREFPLVSISDSQRDPLPDANWIATVHHGLPLQSYVVGPGDGDYFVFLGRISPEKRPHVAIQAARRAGVRLVIAAKVDVVDRAYFETTIAPLLEDPLIEFIGEVDEVDKADLLGNARGLLFPILWPEPFGLAMTEAMAYGTPVITRRCGSTPEVVDHGRVGYVCDDDDEIVAALRRIDRIDRSACRRWVEERFSVERMADRYEELYRRIAEAARRRLPKLRLLHNGHAHVPLATRDLDGHVAGVAAQQKIDGPRADAQVTDPQLLEKRRQYRRGEEHTLAPAVDAESEAGLKQ